jgi:5-hydroxyisourate hydrolase
MSDGTVSISTHVLDTGTGKPASRVLVELLREGEPATVGETDGDGRISPLAEDLEPGTYSLVFHPPSEFFTRVVLEIDLVEGHYHVPLLVSPYGCASYRGS